MTGALTIPLAAIGLAIVLAALLVGRPGARLIWVAVVILIGVISCRLAHGGQLMSDGRLAAFRAALPSVSDERVRQALLSPRTLFYTDREMPPAYQQARGVHSPSYAMNMDPDPTGQNVGNGNREFPWLRAAGCDRVRNLVVLRFVNLPAGTSIVCWDPGEQERSLSWRFPPGAIVGEILMMPHAGELYSWEVRTRIRRQAPTGWDVDVFRPCPTPESLARLLEKLEALPDLAAAALRPLSNRLGRLQDHNPLRRVFREEAGEDALPTLPADLVARILRGAEFTSAAGQPWKTSADGKVICHAPSSRDEFNLVPAGYLGAYVPVDSASCTRCHETVGAPVNRFAMTPGQREWYGVIRGADEIFSYHPWDPSCISGNGGYVEPRLRRQFIAEQLVTVRRPAR